MFVVTKIKAKTQLMSNEFSADNILPFSSCDLSKKNFDRIRGAGRGRGKEEEEDEEEEEEEEVEVEKKSLKSGRRQASKPSGQ